MALRRSLGRHLALMCSVTFQERNISFSPRPNNMFMFMFVHPSDHYMGIKHHLVANKHQRQMFNGSHAWTDYWRQSCWLLRVQQARLFLETWGEITRSTFESEISRARNWIAAQPMTWFCSLLDLRCKLSPCCILQVQQARCCAFFGNVRRNQVTLPTVWLGSISWRFAVWWTGGSTSFWPIQLTVILKPPTPPMKVKSHEQKTELTMDNTVGFALQSFTVLSFAGFTVLSFAGAASLLIFPFGNVGRSQVTLLTKLPHLNSISFNFFQRSKKFCWSFTIFDPERGVLHFF